MAVVVVDGTNPGSRVQSASNAAIIAQVVSNPDGSAIGGGSGTASSSNLPYGADEQVLTNVVGGPGPTVIVYKKAGATVKTRTLTYTGSGPTDVLIRTVDS